MRKTINRRHLLHLGVMGGVSALAACAPTAAPTAAPISASSTEQAYTPAATPPTAPTTAATPPTAPTTAAPAPVAVNAATTSATPAGNTLAGDIGSATTGFLNLLDDSQRTQAMFALTDPERLRWNWTTTSGFPRNGLVLSALQPNQREAALALLRSSVSEAGFKKSVDIMSLQPEIGGDPDNYYVSVFGQPGDAAWGWRFEGHHLSRHFTIAGDQITITPFFQGVWPTVSAAGKSIMQREEWAARELVKSLDDATRAQVVFQERSLTQHVTSNNDYVQPLEAVGAPLSALNNDQQALAMEIIQAWMATQAEPVAKTHLDRINASGLDTLRFGWAGSMEERQPHYYRIQGPSFLLEYDNTRNGAIHIHSVWRVFDQDFGQGLI